MAVSRRRFLRSAALAGISLGLAPYLLWKDSQSAPQRGDMYAFRNSRVPLEIRCVMDGAMKHPFSDRFYSADTRDWRLLYAPGDEPYVRSALDYQAKCSRDFLENWAVQTDFCLGYLSQGRFGIGDTTIHYLTGGQGYALIVSADYSTPRYIGKGVLIMNPFFLQLNTGDFEYNAVGIHEIFHGLLTSEYHSTSPESVMSTSAQRVIGLTKDECKYLGWEHQDPIRLHPVERDVPDTGEKNAVLRKVQSSSTS
jgi:hypothetical protein